MKLFLSRSRASGERGAAMFLIVMALLIVVFAGAFAVDLSATSNRGQELQNAADSAALAGVQAYRASLAARETEAVPVPVPTQADEDAATAAINRILRQNGVEGITPNVTFPDAVGNTEVRVVLVDTSSDGQLLSGFTGVGGGVERSATAKFERCANTCVTPVAIPRPFRDINTFGDGDGYKPIPVGDRLFSINHNSGTMWNGSTRGSRQITCVDRFTGEKCWENAGRVAYTGTSAGNWVPSATPEMPHAAVWDEVIYWVSSTQDGTYLFCYNAIGNFETGYFDTPCSVPFKLNDRAAASVNLVEDTREQHRGGGAFEWGGNIYAFTDDHRLHCVEPGVPLRVCGHGTNQSWIGGRTTQLSQVGFPANDPFDGNNGSSIDRIIDGGKVYSTMHVKNPAAVGAPNCAAPLADPTGEQVVLRNTATGEFLAVQTPRRHEFATNTHRYQIQMVEDGSHLFARWYIDAAGSNGGVDDVFIRSAANTEHLDADWSRTYIGTHRQISAAQIEDERWRLVPQGNGSFKIETAFVGGGASERFELVEFSGDAAEVELDWAPGTNDTWEFWSFECENDNFFGSSAPTISYEAGTYLHCFDLVAAGTCSSFTPQRIHDDPDSFSGRLFFYRTARTPGHRDESIIGICSTGFTTRWRPINMAAATDLTCVDSASGIPNNLEAGMGPFVTALTSTNTGEYGIESGWGTWGDPHWNDHTNRVFYPTHRKGSQVLCWDFDSGSCGNATGASALGTIQDYGFYSDGNCIFGLGHNAIFWAFSASEFGGGSQIEECSGSGKTQEIKPCHCAGEYQWGVMKFNVQIDQFELFNVVIRDEEGTQVYPALSENPADPVPPPHSVISDGDLIDLDQAFGEADENTPALKVIITVEAKDGIDPWASGATTFNIELGQAPVLTD